MRIAASLTCLLVGSTALAAPPPASRHAGPLALDEAWSLLHLADADAGTLVTFDLAHPERAPRTRLVGAMPANAVVLPDHAVVATVREGTLVRLEPDGTLITTEFPGEPLGLARSDDGYTVYISLFGTGEVVAVDARTLEEQWRVEVPERPRHVTVLSDGRLAIGHDTRGDVTFVDPVEREVLMPTRPLAGRRFASPNATNAAVAGLFGTPSGLTDVLGTIGTVGTGRFDPDELVRRSRIREAIARNGIPAAPTVRAFPLELDGALFVTREALHTGSVEGREISSGYGSSFEPPTETMFARLDARDGSIVESGHLASTSSFGEFAGTRMVSDAVPLGTEGVAVVSRIDDLLSIGLRDRRFVPVPGGPAAVAAESSGTRFHVWCADDRVLRTIDVDLEVPSMAEAATVALGTLDEPPEVAWGRRLFHLASSSISSRGLACATCHRDGREDGQVWTIDGTRRQTIALAGRLHDTAPYGWDGGEKTLEENIRRTVGRLGGHADQLGNEAIHALAAYLRSLPPPPSPRAPATRSHDRLVRDGAAVFARADTDCASCHVPDAGFTDGVPHKLRLGGDADPRQLETPSLRALALTAPYLHDGSAPTVEALLASTDGHMGRTKHLGDHDRAALLAYLKAL